MNKSQLEKVIDAIIKGRMLTIIWCKKEEV